MEDSSRRRRLLLMTLGVILAIVAGAAAYILGQGAGGTAPAEVERESVLVAAREILPRTAIVAEDVVVREIPADQVLPQALRDPAVAVGLQAAVPIYPDQQITPNLMLSEEGRDFEIIPVDEEISDNSPHWRAVSVQVPMNRAVGGEVTTGSRVDLLATIDLGALLADQEAIAALEPLSSAACREADFDQNRYRECFSTQFVVQDMQVLKSTPEDGMYILRADLHQAEQIYQLAKHQNDPFSLALRSPRDTRQVDPAEYGETTETIVSQYSFELTLWLRLLELADFPVAIPGFIPGDQDNDDGDTTEPQPAPQQPDQPDEEPPAP